MITVKARRSSFSRSRSLWGSRELLLNLVVRDLKVRYKHSALGFAWSMITPVAMMAVFTFIFTKVFRSPLKDFQVFFLAGFLPWTYFSNSIMGSVEAISGNGHLIKKVYFPREVLPLSTVLSQGIHLLLSLMVFGGYMLFLGYNFLPLIPLLLGVIILQTLFISGLSMAFAGANVKFRDIRELVGVIFLLWFYATPIIYDLSMVPPAYRELLQLNPMTWFINLYREILYYTRLPDLGLWGVCLAISALTLALGWFMFTRLARSFAKEV